MKISIKGIKISVTHQGCCQLHKWILVALCFLITSAQGREIISEKQGYWWGKEVIAEKEESKKPKALPSAKVLFAMHPKKLGKLLDEWKHYAIWKKTPEATLNYYKVVDAIRKNAASFTSLSEFVMQTHPELSSKVSWPTNNLGADEHARQEGQKETVFLTENRKNFALIFFVQEGCGFCQAQIKALTYFQKKHRWLIKTVDILRRPDIAQKFNVRTTPSLVVLKKNSQKWLPVTTGVESLPVIEDNLIRAINYLKGQTKGLQFNLNLMEIGGYFDPKQEGY